MIPASPLLRQLDERFDEVRGIVTRQIEKERRTLVGGLGKAFRRLRGYQDEAEWAAALLDAATPFCTRCALFVVNANKIEWKSSRGFEIGGAPLPSFAIADAASFAAAIESRELTVTLCTSREVSSALTHLLGEDPSRKVVLIPVATKDRVVGVLYAEDAETDGLDLVGGMAGAALESNRRNESKGSGNGLLQIANAVIPAAATPAVAMPPEEEAVHLRARRLARKLAAEIRLHESGGVKAGRTAANLYDGPVRARMDQARETYRNQFLAGASTNMVDYLHQEFVRTLANGNEAWMGAEYPGPLG